MASFGNSVMALREGRKVREGMDRLVVPPPLFILGHWRSGTTHLHNLLALDPAFASPSLYEVIFPHTFATTGSFKEAFSRVLPRTRLIDGMRLEFDAPYEDEFALFTATLLSPYGGLVFPRRIRHYDRYLTLDGLTGEEVRAWKEGLLWFVRKLTWKHGKPLLLKSPPHTCRIRLLLDLFPEARFVHISRDPYTVFQSTRVMLERGIPLAQLQRFDPGELDDLIIERYQIMYRVYLEQRGSIAPGRLHELRFEDLEGNPVAALRGTYAALGLPGFEPIEPLLRNYLGSVKDYQKNRHRELASPLRERIAAAWKPAFEAWGYPA